MTKEPKTSFFQLRVEPSFLRRLDDIRRMEPELPSRTTVARRILDAALDARLGKPAKGKRKDA